MSILSNLLSKLVNEAEKAVKEAVNAPEGAPADAPASAPVYHEADNSELGFYDDVPAEECQYNFNGNYIEYFRKVFSEEFPEYTITEENITPGRRYAFTFNSNGAIALVVELMTEKSSVQKLRRSCEAAGIKYLRYYFDHEGWWNTRAYVTERTRRALNS